MKGPNEDCMADHTQTKPAAKLTRMEIASIMAGLMVAMFPGALDTTIIGPAMPTIGRELGDVEHLPWIVTSYLLVSTAATPLYGKLSDIHGRRIMLLWAIGLFALGSVACAMAPTMITLALARALQAVGGGGLISLAMTIVGDIVPPLERPKYQVYTSVMWTTSSLLGPALGGYLADKWHWSLIFWINLPLCLAAYFMTDSKLKRLPRYERPHKLDFGGAGLLIVASVLVQLMLSWGGTRYPWSSAPVLGVMAAAVVALALLTWRLRTAAEPLIPLRLLSNKVVLTGGIAVGLCMGVFIGLSIYVPIYFETIMGLSATQSGLALLPLMTGSTIGAVICGKLMATMPRYKIAPMIGLLLGGLCLLPLFFQPEGMSLLTVEILFTVVSIGVGGVFPVTTISIQNAVPRHDLGTATALITFMRNLGAATGVAVFGTLVIGGGLGESAGAAAYGPDYVAQFRWIFMAGALGFLLSASVLAAMEERPLRARGSGQI